MKWEELTAKQFEIVVKEVSVCIITFGVVEKHGDHLPLGTDYMNVHHLAYQASLKESAIVFPPFYFGQIYEAMCFPGTIAIQPKLLFELTENIVEEVARNGFTKIILLNGHGGNDAFLKFFVQTQLSQNKSYQVYLYQPYSEKRSAYYKEICDSTIHGHACECETSISLHHHSHLVHMAEVPKAVKEPDQKFSNIPNLFHALSWYSNYPEHYVGDASLATKEKGKYLFDFDVNQFAQFIKNVKEDKIANSLLEHFQKKEI